MVSGHQIKVLMIDASRFNRLLIEKRLAAEPGISFRHATDVDAGLRIADQYLPTVVLLSLDPSRPDALARIEAVAGHPSTCQVPVIALCPAGEAELGESALAAGAGDYFLLSADPAALLQRIRLSSGRYLEALRRQLPGEAPAESESEPARVLMIDDSRTVCMGVEKVLRNEPGTLFAYCTDPKQGLQKARDFSPTVILLDLEMPGVDGFDLLPRLRADPLTRDVPIIVLSGITDPSVKARVFALGANDYAEKNMDRVELVSRIRYHTRGFLNAEKLDRSITELLEARKRLEIQRDFIRKTFGRYLSDEIVDSILETPEGLELGGEKRVISIMMADLRGFTSVSERLPPEKVLSVLNNFLQVMTEVLTRHHATIDEIIGDAILAMFGAPVKRQDDAQQAVACAVEMQLSMQRVNEINRRLGLPETAMGIGIHTGEVVVGNIGSERRAKYGIVGQNVNLTSRIESYTVGGQILISDTTRLACGPILRIDGELEVIAKGVEQPITVYEVGGIGGTHALFLPEKRLSLFPAVAAPLQVRISILKGKHPGRRAYQGTVAGLSASGAIISTDAPVRPLQNLKLTLLGPDGETVTDQLYAKALELTSDEPRQIKVRFTSVPEEARVFLEAVPRVL
jgi:adenylate cyclase